MTPRLIGGYWPSGQPFYNCIVWLDNRTSDLVDHMLDHIPGRDLNWFKRKTGLPISTYFSALKLKWLINEIPGIAAAIAEKRLLFGTVDSWILWKLTGNHMTDVSNASRTLLMDIETLDWDPYLLDFFKIRRHILPEIKNSSDYFGEITTGPLKGLPITGTTILCHSFVICLSLIILCTRIAKQLIAINIWDFALKNKFLRKHLIRDNEFFNYL